MEQSKFSFDLTTTNAGAKLGFEVWINDQCMFNTDHVTDPILVTGVLPNDSVETEHTLKLILKNKQTEHTTISESGEILHDSCLTISQIKFDNIDLGQIVSDLAVYKHDFNGSQPAGEYQFFGTMGCNGSVNLKFTTPFYLWLLENM